MTCLLNILLILPDSTKNPFGGMGVQAEGIMSNMLDVNFFEHNINTSDFFQVSENVDNSVVISQILSQATQLPKLDLLQKIDIVHSFDASTSIQGNAIAKMINKPHIMTLQLSMNSLFNIFYNKTDELVSGIEFSCMNSADAVIHVSKEYLNKYAILNPNSYYLPNGIDLNKWENTSVQKIDLIGRKNSKKLCYIGRYAEMKNIEAILNAKIPKEIDIYFIGSQRGGHEYYFSKMLGDLISSGKSAPGATSVKIYLSGGYNQKQYNIDEQFRNHTFKRGSFGISKDFYPLRFIHWGPYLGYGMETVKWEGSKNIVSSNFAEMGVRVGLNIAYNIQLVASYNYYHFVNSILLDGNKEVIEKNFPYQNKFTDRSRSGISMGIRIML